MMPFGKLYHAVIVSVDDWWIKSHGVHGGIGLAAGGKISDFTLIAPVLVLLLPVQILSGRTQSGGLRRQNDFCR